MRPRPHRILLLGVAMCVALAPRTARALQLGGNLEFDHSHSESESKSPGVDPSSSTSDFLQQRLIMSLSEPLFPKLSLSGGGILDNSLPITRTDGEHGKTDLLRWNGFGTIALTDHVYGAETTYSRQGEEDLIAGSGASPLVREQISGSLRWRPEALPALALRLARSHSFDEEEASLDQVSESLTLSTRYRPVQPVEVNYGFSYDQSNDRVSDLELRSWRHNGQVSYTDRLFGTRVVPTARYTIARQDSAASAGGEGEVPFPVTAFSGLSAVDDLPGEGELQPNRSLIDGDLQASSGVDLGRDPTIQGDTDPRNVGLDLFSPVEVNLLRLWIDRELPAGVATSYSWSVYTSDDNREWALLRTVGSAPFGPFENRFEIRFQNVKTRFVKVVTRPLGLVVPAPPNLDVEHVLVTELQALLEKPASEVRGGEGSTTQSANVEVGVRVLDTPTVYYQLSESISRADPGGWGTNYLANRLSAIHVFNRYLSGGASLGFDWRAGGRTASLSSLVYNASLTASPIEALYHTLVYGGRSQWQRGELSEQNSIHLGNTVRLYRGVDVGLAGGVSIDTSEGRGREIGMVVTSGLDLRPHRDFGVNLSYSASKTDSSQLAGPQERDPSQVAGAGVSFQPFQTIYLSASVDVTTGGGQKGFTSQSYALGWSPLTGRDLQFTFGFSEAHSNRGAGTDRLVSPSLRWVIRPGTFLDLSYGFSDSTSSFGDSRRQDVTTRFWTAF